MGVGQRLVQVAVQEAALRAGQVEAESEEGTGWMGREMVLVAPGVVPTSCSIAKPLCDIWTRIGSLCACPLTDPPVLFAVSRSLQSSLPCHGPSSPIPEGRPPDTSYLIPSPLWPHVLDLKVNPSSEDECLAPRRS